MVIHIFVVVLYGYLYFEVYFLLLVSHFFGGRVEVDGADLELGTRQRKFARYRSDKGEDEGEWTGGQGLRFVSAEARACGRERKGSGNGRRSVGRV